MPENTTCSLKKSMRSKNGVGGTDKNLVQSSGRAAEPTVSPEESWRIYLDLVPTKLGIKEDKKHTV